MDSRGHVVERQHSLPRSSVLFREHWAFQKDIGIIATFLFADRPTQCYVWLDMLPMASWATTFAQLFHRPRSIGWRERYAATSSKTSGTRSQATHATPIPVANRHHADQKQPPVAAKSLPNEQRPRDISDDRYVTALARLCQCLLTLRGSSFSNAWRSAHALNARSLNFEVRYSSGCISFTLAKPVLKLLRASKNRKPLSPYEEPS
jgi:hypothetical protein